MSWRTVQASVLGAAHRRDGRANQDACKSTGGTVALVAVADGHGGARYQHSARGAQIACEVAHEVGAQLSREPLDVAALACEVVDRWRARVGAEPAAQGFEAFGSTLVFAVLSERWSLFFQLGDGDLRVIDERGELRGPLPDDPLILGPATTSLVMDDAWRHARVAVVPAATYRPRVVVITTDGVSGSFAAADGLTRFVRGVEALVAGDEAPAMEDRLRDVLGRYSAGGSGDDATVAVAWRDGNGR